MDFSIRVMRTRLPTENTFLTDGKVVPCLVTLGSLVAARWLQRGEFERKISVLRLDLFYNSGGWRL